MNTSTSNRYIRRDQLVYRFVQDQALIVNTARNSWHRLNSTGARIFDLLGSPSTEENIFQQLRSEINPDEVGNDELRNDCSEFLEYLLGEDIVCKEYDPPLPRGRLCVDDWRDEMDATGIELMIPVWAKMEISTRCHLNCAHCYIPFSERAPKGPLRVTRSQEEMHDAEILSTIDQLAELGTVLLTITGGEIFAKQNLMEILTHADSRGFILELFTSGTLMTPAKVDALTRLKIGRVQISVYSASEEPHDRFTGSAGSWRRSIQAIRMLAEHGIHVELACSITPFNYDEVLLIRDLAYSLGATCSYGYPITARTNGDRDTHQHRLAPEQLRDSIRTLPDFFAIPDVKAPEQRICPAGVNMCSIGATGEVYSCSQFMLPAGNIREKRLADIWLTSPVLQRIRQLRTADLKPSRLGRFDRYVGLCPGLNLLEEGDFLVPAAVTAETTAAVLEVLNDSSTDPAIKHRLLHPSNLSMRPESS